MVCRDAINRVSTCVMLAIKDTLVSEELIEKKFVCDLHACKGGCCVKGDYGAPLEEEELPMLDKIADAVKPYLSEEGRQALVKQGHYLLYEKKEWVTPLIKGRECAYTVFEKGVAKCGIEKAYFDGKIDFFPPLGFQRDPGCISDMDNDERDATGTFKEILPK